MAKRKKKRGANTARKIVNRGTKGDLNSQELATVAGAMASFQAREKAAGRELNSKDVSRLTAEMMDTMRRRKAMQRGLD